MRYAVGALVILSTLLLVGCAAPQPPPRSGRARIINADNMTIVGTTEQIAEILGLFRGGASVVNMQGATLIVVAEPLSREQGQQRAGVHRPDPAKTP